MHLILILVSDPATPAVDAALLKEAAALAEAGASAAVLAEGIAGEIAFEADSAGAKSVEARIRALIGDRPIDVAVLPATHRRKRLLVADMDSTIIRQECIDELADLVGLKALVAAITQRAMRGEVAFEPALRERVALLKGLPVAVIDRLLAERIELMPGATTLVRTMRASGAHAALVSGGFTAFTGPIAAKVGFNEHSSNELVVEAGLIAGRVVEPVKGREAKLATLTELTRRLGLRPEETLAIGDGANDLAMIGAAGLGVAYHAKPAVAAAARARIDFGDLTALLYLQGFRRAEFVT